MEYIANVYVALCALSEFKINGIEAYQDDFIDLYDHASSIAEEYCCGNMRADVKLASQQVLDKYKITLDEYYIIAYDISNKVSFGSCCLCS